MNDKNVLKAIEGQPSWTESDCNIMKELFENRLKDLESATQLLRLLRNSCVDEEKLKLLTEFVNHSVVMKKLQELHANRDLSGEEITFIRCSFQFWHNFFSSLVDIDKDLVEGVFQTLQPWLSNLDEKVSNYSASVLMVFLNKNKEFDFSTDTIEALVNVAKSEGEFALYCLNLVLERNSEFFCSVFMSLRQDSRLFFLDLFQEELHQGKTLSNPIIDLVSQRLQAEARKVLTSGKILVQEPLEMSKLVTLICEISGHDQLKEEVQRVKSVLIDSLYLLRMIQDLGKSEVTNEFTPVTKASETVEENDPVFGFKRDLVRLIGNLVWKHKENQNLVRELEGIPLLLDCTPIDVKNPYMTQWVVFALRNLCEDNEENKAVLKKLDGKGISVTCI